MSFIDGAALLMLFALSLKAATRTRSAGKPKHWLLEGILHSPAEAKSQPVFRTETVVDFGIK
jgi:hypothetical protein